MLVVNNARDGSDAGAFRLQLPAEEAGRLVPGVAVETSAHRDLEPVELPTVSAGGLLSARVAAQSVTTYVLYDRSASPART